MDIKTYFLREFKMHQSTNGWYEMYNPFIQSRKRTMYVNFEFFWIRDFKTGYSSSLLPFVCQYSGLSMRQVKQMITSRSDYSDKTIKVNYAPVKNKVITLPDGFQFIGDPKGSLGRQAQAYLRGRGFSIKKLDKIGFGYVCNPKSKFHGYIIIPFKQNNLVNYYIGRSFMGHDEKYRNPDTQESRLKKSQVFFNESALYQFKKVYLSEGWSDALTCGKKGVASLGWSLSDTQVSILLRAPVESICLVPDVGFYYKALHTALKLVQYKNVSIYNLDPYEQYGGDIDEIGRKRVFSQPAEKLSYSLITKKLLRYAEMR